MVYLYIFDMDFLLWFKLLIIVEFNEEKELFVYGGFCNVYRVIIKYL